MLEDQQYEIVPGDYFIKIALYGLAVHVVSKTISWANPQAKTASQSFIKL